LIGYRYNQTETLAQAVTRFGAFTGFGSRRFLKVRHNFTSRASAANPAVSTASTVRQRLENLPTDAV